MRTTLARHWRDLLARAPLPMLALAASYGVYSYQLLFVPAWAALMSAAAFEATYLALALVGTPDPRRATAISVAAVVVSVAYNTLSALFVRRPALLIDTPLWGDVALAVLHGLPLAVVAYNVAALLLHATPARDDRAIRDTPAIAPPCQMTQVVQVVERSATPATPALADAAPRRDVKALAAAEGVSVRTMYRRIQRQEGLS